jgi:hypothetical protein
MAIASTGAGGLGTAAMTGGDAPRDGGQIPGGG